MPGTMGSLASYPIVPIILSNRILGAATIIFLFLIEVWSIDNYIKHYQTSHKPKEVVIDEVVGQFLTIFLISVLLNQEMNCPLLLLCFFLLGYLI
nr:phosphatidylglycerophosphatase A [Wolbachia endosymbiont of Atemnus politus]